MPCEDVSKSVRGKQNTMKSPEARYVLDTTAMLAFTEKELGADRVRTILREGERGQAQVMLSFMTFMEAYYRIWQKEGREKADEVLALLSALPVERIDVSDDLIRLAGEIKALFNLSVADAWIAATAIQQESKLVHKDPEFEQLRDRVALEPLPYKPKARA